jgi:hypothetical protein
MRGDEREETYNPSLSKTELRKGCWSSDSRCCQRSKEKRSIELHIARKWIVRMSIKRLKLSGSEQSTVVRLAARIEDDEKE